MAAILDSFFRLRWATAQNGRRQKGTRNKATIERELRAAASIQAAIDEAMLPLDVILR